MRPIDELREKIDLWKKSTTDTALMSVLHDVLKQIDVAIYEMDHQETESTWRRVEDGLPEPIHPTNQRYKAYLICDSLGYMHVADYTYSKHFPTCYSFCVNGEEETDVKYWMPLPEPPKEGD